MLRAAAAAVAVMAAFLGVMYVRFSGDSVSAPDPTPSPAAEETSSPTPIAGALPEFLMGTEPIRLAMGSEIELPPYVALIVETGCWQCDGPSSGFVRVHRDAGGAVRTDKLLDASVLGLGTRMVSTSNGIEEREPYITGFAMTPDASDMAVSVCVTETCGSGGLDSWSPGSETVILRSTDGGVSWSELARVDAGALVVALADDGRAIIGEWEGENRPATFAYLPGLEPIEVPAQGSWPVGFLDGEILWLIPPGSGLSLGDQPLIYFGENAGITSVAVAPPNSEPRLAVSWNWPRTTKEQAYFLTLIDSRGRSFDTYEFGAFAIAGVTLVTELWGNADVSRSPSPGGYLPSVIDLNARLIRPMTQPFLDPAFLGGRNQIAGVQRGPFARVVNTDNTCLNIRSEPSTTAPALDCTAEGVLLRDTGDEALTDVVWVRVVTPSGTEGWASTQYLER